MAEDSIFTKIMNGEIPSEIVYRDDLVTAIKDIAPKAPTHILIITNKQIPTVSDVEPSDEVMMGHLFTVAKKLATDMGIAQSGYRLIVNCGPDGGQEVPHIHMHFLAGGKLGGLGFPA